jgi:hypothetical protein
MKMYENKKALVVAINYVGKEHELKGPTFDGRGIADLLYRKGFNVTLLIEEDATAYRIKESLAALVDGATIGDVLVFYYSGHGTQVPSKGESDNYEEAIVPYDMDWVNNIVYDNDFRRIFNKVPAGVNTTVILDCCHSGDMLDQEVHTHVMADEAESSRHLGPVKVRFLLPPMAILEKLKETQVVNWATSKDVNATALLVAACRSYQVSLEMEIDGQIQGLATYALLKTLRHNPGINYIDLIREMSLVCLGFKAAQRPELDGLPYLHNTLFLEPFKSPKDIAAIPAVVALQQNQPVAEQEKKEPRLKLLLAVSLALIIGAAIFIIRF